jgi:two-component system, chemotaxis family, chemotaxis protein CheY
MKILIVDDSKAMRMIVRRTLCQAGFEAHDVEEAANGREGLSKVEGYQPDLVLSDWNMPELDGIDFLRHLRARGNQVQFGFVTSESTEEMKALASSNGAEFLIAKPFDGDTFKQVLTPYLR